MWRKMQVAAGLTLALAVGGCSEAPTAPDDTLRPSGGLLAQRAPHGTGLVLENLTGVTLPLIGRVGEVVVDQAVITELILVEDVVGNLVGLQAEGVLRLTGGVLGTDVVTEEFRTQVDIASSGRGGCDVVTVDLGRIDLSLPLGLASVDAEAVELTPRASGALGSLLCNLGDLLQGPISGATSAVRGLVNAINRII